MLKGIKMGNMNGNGANEEQGNHGETGKRGGWQMLLAFPI